MKNNTNKNKFKDLSNLFTSFESFEDITNNNEGKNNFKFSSRLF